MPSDDLPDYILRSAPAEDPDPQPELTERDLYARALAGTLGGYLVINLASDNYNYSVITTSPPFRIIGHITYDNNNQNYTRYTVWVPR